MLNLIFVFAIIVSFVCYFYYKTKQFRSTLPIAKKWYTHKAGVALGLLITIFGINQAYLFSGLLTYSVAAIFILLGVVVIISNFKRMRHYGQFVKEEYTLNKQS